MPPSASARPLSSLQAGLQGRVREVPKGDDALARRLLEIGFVPGAVVEVLASMWPGGDPLAIRVGGSMFALRRLEAERVMVEVAAVAGDVS
jgi:ferrous iron transport protein A